MSAIKLIAMVAMTSDRVIGKENDLPWHLPEDLQLFKKTTSGHPIVMGRKTYESIGRPLPKRQNIVITRDREWSAEGVDVVHSPEAVRELDLQDETVFIIGGAEIFAHFMPYIDELLVSHVYKNYEGDTFFPEFVEYFTDYEMVEKFDGFELRRYRKL
ncbi:dihydrofolate reductase [Rubritalea spongiae]|uniref:Dihydrofolate reductase n=1 Tax=Rubritalea spongiae TaxID=430797 RepID=A0ABW5E5H6_9BACT